MDTQKYGMVFHHLGYATHSISGSIKMFLNMGYEVSGTTFMDRSQGIAGVFLTGGGPKIELLESLPDEETLKPWLRNGPRFYHMAYEVDNIKIAASFSKTYSGKIVSPPVSSVAFSGRQICFIMFRDNFLVELIEKRRSGGQ